MEAKLEVLKRLKREKDFDERVADILLKETVNNEEWADSATSLDEMIDRVKQIVNKKMMEEVKNWDRQQDDTE